jgi:hypothetical protein
LLFTKIQLTKKYSVLNPTKIISNKIKKNYTKNTKETNLAELSSVAPYHQPPQPPQQIVTKHVTAPIDKPPSSNPLPPGQNICADCERLIV